MGITDPQKASVLLLFWPLIIVARMTLELLTLLGVLLVGGCSTQVGESTHQLGDAFEILLARVS